MKTWRWSTASRAKSSSCWKEFQSDLSLDVNRGMPQITVTVDRPAAERYDVAPTRSWKSCTQDRRKAVGVIRDGTDASLGLLATPKPPKTLLLTCRRNRLMPPFSCGNAAPQLCQIRCLRQGSTAVAEGKPIPDPALRPSRPTEKTSASSGSSDRPLSRLRGAGRASAGGRAPRGAPMPIPAGVIRTLGKKGPAQSRPHGAGG